MTGASGSNPSKPRKVALVHDWLTGMRGGEKVLEVFCKVFPKADLFTLFHVPGQVSAAIESHRIITSPLQYVPGIAGYYRRLLPLMPWAIERLDFSGYDLLISTSHCVAKAARPAKGARHVCYCFTPMRYIWDQYDSYFGAGRASLPVRLGMKMLRPSLQRWDLATLPRVDTFISDCENVRERVERIYHRRSPIIYPPVDVDFYGVQSPKSEVLTSDVGHRTSDDFYLIVSALAPYKRLDIAIEAFRRLGKKLVVIGEGQESKTLRESAGPTIEFKGWRSNEELRTHFQTCRALIFPGEEDFGIVPLEAMAAGAPVIALRKGGALETVKEGRTGVFFDQPTPEALMQAITRFESLSWDTVAIRRQADLFNWHRCEEAIRSFFIEYQGEMS